MSKDIQGASADADRATRASTEPASGLGHSAGIPSARRRKPLLCRLGLHWFRFRRPTITGTGAFEVCRRCGRGRILHFVGAYQYFDTKEG